MFTKEEKRILVAILKVKIYDLENSEPRPSKQYHRCYTQALRSILENVQLSEGFP